MFLRNKNNHRSTSQKKLRRLYVLAVTLPLLFILIPIVFLSLNRANRTEAAWFDTNWSYRQRVNIPSHTSLETNVYVTVPSFDATDTTKFQADCGDLRFTKQNGELLTFYVVDCDATANIHVFFDSLPAGESNYYMYYGNIAAQNGFVAADFSTAATGLGTLALASEEETPGFTAQWKLDDAQGQTIQDSTNNNFDGVLGVDSGSASDDPTWKPDGECVNGTCLSFDGTDDYVSVASTVNGIQTIGLWVKPTSISSAALIDINGTARLTVSSGTISATGFTSPTIYVDGVVKSTLSANSWQYVEVTTGTALTGSAIKLGAYSTTFLTGFIDEVKIYPYARSAAQVKIDYNNGSANIGTPSRANLSKGLVGYWKMDESSWTNNCSTASVLDSSGFGTNARSCPNSTGPTGGAAGKFGLAGSFDGTDDYVSPASSTPLDITAASVSVSAWINPTTVAGTYGIAGKANGTIYGYGINTSTTALQMGLRAPITQNQFACSSAGGLIAANVWTHVAGTVQDIGTGTIAKLYVNGALVKVCSSVEHIGASGSLFAIGARGGVPVGALFPGKIDEVRVYNRELSGAEVNLLATEGNGPVGYWKFDENTGTTANDTSTFDNSVALTNSPTWVSGKYGGGLNFAGSDQHLTRADDADFDFADDADMSVEAFFRHSTASAQQIILSKFNEAGYKIIMESDGDITCALDYDSTWTPTDSVTSTAATYDDNLWHHVACIKNGASTLKLYIDGILIGTDSALTATNTLTNSDPLYIGIDADGTSNDWVGQIDEVKIYTYARSAGQIIEDMNASHPLGGSPVGSYVSYWSLDQNQGTTANDQSQNANNLTLNTSSWTSSGKFNSAWNGIGTNWLSRADDEDLDFVAADDFSIAFWFKSDSATNPGATEYLLDKSLSGGTQSAGYAIYAKTTGVICIGIDDDTTWTPDDESCSTNDVYDGTWHHVVAIKNNNTSISLVVDGLPVGIDATIAATGTLANARIFYLGDRDGVDNGDEWNGDLDDVRIYRAFLTDEQVRIAMNVGSSLNIGSTASSEVSTLTDGAGSVSISYLQFDDNTGTTAVDTSSTGNNGTLTSGPTWAAGKIGGAVKLDGSNDYVALPNNITDTHTTGTVCSWVFYDKPTDDGTQGAIFSVADTGGTIVKHNLYISDSGADVAKIRVTIRQDGTANDQYDYFSADNAISRRTWTHLCIRQAGAGAGVEFFVNGTEISLTATDAGSGNLNDWFDDGAASVESITIGNIQDNSPDSFFTGMIDEFKLYNYARTDSQIAYDYSRGKPIGHWKLDECGGTVINDSSGKAQTGTLTVTATGGNTNGVGTCNTATSAWGSGATGKFNSSLYFDGNGDYVTIGTSPTIGTGDFSVSVWFKSTGSGELHFVDAGTAGNANSLVLRYATGCLRMLVSTQAVQGGCKTLNDGNWHHVVLTGVRAGNAYLYLDGKLVVTQSISGVSANSINQTWRLGTEGGANFYIGQLDDVQIFNYALSATQVKTLYNNNSAIRYGPNEGSP